MTTALPPQLQLEKDLDNHDGDESYPPQPQSPAMKLAFPLVVFVWCFAAAAVAGVYAGIVWGVARRVAALFS